VRHFEPVVEQCRIDAAKVDGVDRVAIVEPRQVGVCSVQAGLDWLPQEDYRGRGAMVGPAAAVFGQTPELGKYQHNNSLRIARFAQIVHESSQRRAELAHQVCVLRELTAVRIKAVQMSIGRRGMGRR
jgi:hypothetical protein